MRALRWAVLVASLCGGALAAAPSGEYRPDALARIALPSDVEDEAERLESQLQSLKREGRERQALTVARGRAYVRLARAGLMPLSDGFDALADHASRMERLRRALGRDLDRQRQIVAQRLEVSRALQALDNLRPADRQAVARARNAIVAAEERDQAFRRAFESGWQPHARTAVYGARPAPGNRAQRSGGFYGQRGRLPFPLAGRAEVQSIRSPSGTGKALVMVSAPGATVRAVHRGRVAFADDYPGLGKTVIVDHGEQHYSVSAHLAAISVAAGEELTSGQRLGTVGSYDERSALLFEIRSGQKTLNTPEWFGL